MNGNLMTADVYDCNDHYKEYCGTLNYYQLIDVSTKYLLTDGVYQVIQDNKCNWLLKKIVSFQKVLVNESFQCWELKRDVIMDAGRIYERSSSFILTCDDGNHNILKTYKIKELEFPFDVLKIWLQDDYFLLPSEY